MPVQLRYEGPADADVAVAGSWDGWTARVPLAYIGGGVHARLLNLEPGTHHYKYVGEQVMMRLYSRGASLWSSLTRR